MRVTALALAAAASPALALVLGDQSGDVVAQVSEQIIRLCEQIDGRLAPLLPPPLARCLQLGQVDVRCRNLHHLLAKHPLGDRLVVVQVDGCACGERLEVDDDGRPGAGASAPGGGGGGS